MFKKLRMRKKVLTNGECKRVDSVYRCSESTRVFVVVIARVENWVTKDDCFVCPNVCYILIQDGGESNVQVLINI